jgi:hypothetical protein
VFINRARYGCASARNKGTCSNHLTVRRDEIEPVVLEGMKEHLMAPELVKEFIVEFHREINRLRRAQSGRLDAARLELARVETQNRAIIDAVKNGLFHDSMCEELTRLEARKSELKADLATAPDPAPLLHPALAEVYKQRVTGLREALDSDDAREEAAEILRSLIDRIVLTPTDGGLAVDLHGELAAILRFAQSRNERAAPVNRDSPAVEQLKLVAGTCNHRQFAPVVVAI